MIIKQITLNNFRIYRGQHSIYFNPEEHKNIFIISGYNGYGKTTFLTALIWCLYGKNMKDVDDSYKSDIYEAGGYQSYLSSCLNRLSLKEKQYSFSVGIKFQDVNIPNITCSELEIIRSCDYERGVDHLEIMIDGAKNELTKEVGPEIFINDFLLPKEIAKFFFFDSEKIVELAELKSVHQKRQLSKAYAEVLGIKKYEDLREQLSNMRLRFSKSSATQAEQSKFNEHEQKISSIEYELEEIDTRVEEIEEQVVQHKKKVNDLQEQLIRMGSGLSFEEIEKLRAKKESYIQEREELQSQFKELLELAPFAIVGKVTKKIEEQLHAEQKLKQQTVSSDILKGKAQAIQDAFDEAINTDNTPDSLKERLKQKLHDILNMELRITDEQLEDIRVLHDFSQEQVLSFKSVVTQLKSTYHERLKKLIKDIRVNKSNYTRTSNKLSQAESKAKDEVVKQYRDEKRAVSHKMQQKTQEKESLLERKGALENELVSKRKVYEELRKKIRVKELYKEKDLLAQSLVQELDDFILSIKAEKKASLENRILNTMHSLMHKQDFIERVEVQIEGDIIDILLFNDRDEEINREGLSKGEQQLYASSILKALVDESNIEFPVFIDSPLQKFDAKHASNIIQYFYPSISKQVVLFPLLNKELSEGEYELLKPKVKSATVINNVDDDTSELLPVQNVDKLFDFVEQLNQEKEPQIL